MGWGKTERTPASPFVWTLACNADNFAYVIIEPVSKQAAVVDGVDPDEVSALLKREHAELKYILTTHHHQDHSSGDAELKRLYPAAAHIHATKPAEALTLGTRLTIEAVPTPVHTMDHLCFYLVDATAAEAPCVFTGDFLFRCGCGYFFEGTAEDFDRSVRALFAVCDVDRTLMFFGHEYCEGNYRFATHFDPENEQLAAASKRVQALVPPTTRTPTPLKEELELNPFVRAVLRPESLPERHRNAAAGQLLAGYVRSAKNSFK